MSSTSGSKASFTFGAKVETHSLTTVEYNGLTGMVTGPVVEKNGVTRVPVKVQLRDGSKEGMRLQPKNLHLSKESPNLRQIFDRHQALLAQKGLHEAIEQGNTSKIQGYVDRGADVNFIMEHVRYTPLYCAAGLGHVSTIELLAKLGADINHANYKGHTPVYVAAKGGYVDAVRALAKLGANIHTPAKDGATPMTIASGYNYVEVIKALAELGGDVNTRDSLGLTPIMNAAAMGHADAVRTLAKLGADINTPAGDKGIFPACKGKSRVNPVLIAARQGHTAVIKALYKLGADMRPDFECSVKDAAADQQHSEAVELIEKILAKMIYECESCGCSSKRLKKCSKCEKVRYCSVECQKQDHKKHKQECFAPLSPSSAAP